MHSHRFRALNKLATRDKRPVLSGVGKRFRNGLIRRARVAKTRPKNGSIGFAYKSQRAKYL